MGNGRGFSGRGLSGRRVPGESAEGRLKWLRVMGAAFLLLSVAGAMMSSGSRRSARTAVDGCDPFERAVKRRQSRFQAAVVDAFGEQVLINHLQSIADGCREGRRTAREVVGGIGGGDAGAFTRGVGQLLLEGDCAAEVKNSDYEQNQ